MFAGATEAGFEQAPREGSCSEGWESPFHPPGRQEAALRVFLMVWCLSGMSSCDSQLGWGHFGVPTVGVAQEEPWGAQACGQRSGRAPPHVSGKFGLNV